MITSSNSINNTTASGDGLQLGLGDNALIQSAGWVLATGSNGTGIYVNGYAEESTVVVDGLVYGTNSGIYSLGQYAVIRVNGHVMGDSAGVRIANGGYLYVRATGVLSGFEGLAMQESDVINDGTINGTGNDAMQMASGWLVNNGLISSRFDAIFYGGDAAGSITNTGTIQGSLSTWYNASADTAKLTIDNSGDWIGSLGLTPGDDTVTNTGRIDGSVYLGNGVNSLDSRYGLITGSVSGGSGVDTILLGAGDTTIEGGAGADRIDGGAGYDTVAYQTSAAGVSVNLLLGTATGGDAQGDRLSNIEAVNGSLNRDTLVGDDGNNVLQGLLGRDTLIGNGGNDTITMLGTGTATIDAGSGNDLVQLVTFDSVTYGYAFRSTVQVNGGSGYDILEVTRAPTMTFTNHDRARHRTVGRG